MRLLYLGYWGSADALTVATILPHVRVLAAHPDVDEIILCTIERGTTAALLALPKVKHIPLQSRNKGNVFLIKIQDYFNIFRALKDICQLYTVDLIICRSSLAGAFGRRLKKSLNIPYVVESFEPHRAYMVESHIWKWYDPRAIIQSAEEQKQKRSANYLLPVSHNYAIELRKEGVPTDRLHVLPCCVDPEKFRYDEVKRLLVRGENAIPQRAVAGIYVGKFGDIYYDREAFAIYKKAFDYFGEEFRLIILSGQDRQQILARLKEHSIDTEKVICRSVTHEKVNDWLCAADFAFCTIRPAPSRKFCSPVKNGEYWACGLPVIIEPNIGDDSGIIENEGGGVIVQDGDYNSAFNEIKKLLVQGRAGLAVSVRSIALRHRNADLIRETYDHILGKVRRS